MIDLQNISLHLHKEGGTMRISRDEIDNLVQCQLFVLNLHCKVVCHHEKSSWWGSPFILLHDIMYLSIKGIHTSILIKFSEKTT